LSSYFYSFLPYFIKANEFLLKRGKEKMIIEHDVEPKYIGVRAAADYLGCSMSTVWKLIRDAHIPSYKIISTTRLKISEIDEYVESRQVVKYG
jgi:excisionase family DNA binding protein